MTNKSGNPQIMAGRAVIRSKEDWKAFGKAVLPCATIGCGLGGFVGGLIGFIVADAYGVAVSCQNQHKRGG